VWPAACVRAVRGVSPVLRKNARVVKYYTCHGRNRDNQRATPPVFENSIRSIAIMSAQCACDDGELPPRAPRETGSVAARSSAVPPEEAALECRAWRCVRAACL